MILNLSIVNRNVHANYNVTNKNIISKFLGFWSLCFILGPSKTSQMIQNTLWLRLLGAQPSARFCPFFEKAAPIASLAWPNQTRLKMKRTKYVKV